MHSGHGLAAVQRRRSEGALTPDEQDIRADILAGLIADSSGVRVCCSEILEGTRKIEVTDLFDRETNL
jgi:hypothetical protein